jgi:SAM-dependent methyltransferase
MHERHKDRKRYFDEQTFTTRKYVIPFIAAHLPIDADVRVLEIGCGEGGNMQAFLELGCQSTGVDLNKKQIQRAEEYLRPYIEKRQAQVLAKDIYKVDLDKIGRFDLIIMRDVIEHIFDQEKFMDFLPQLLKPGGRVFFGFPPWYMPFGGHQQICRNKFLSVLPYFHLLPAGFYKFLLQSFKESPGITNELINIKKTGISIERFKRILRNENYQIDQERFYLINPNYEIKFGLRPRRQLPILDKIPFIRNFYTTCAYYLVSKP